MGLFNHEAAAVDPVGKRVYMTEDEGDGCFYRFTPTAYPDLSSGTLEVLVGAPGGPVTWARVPDPSQITGGPTRDQVPGAATFSRRRGHLVRQRHRLLLDQGREPRSTPTTPRRACSR